MKNKGPQSTMLVLITAFLLINLIINKEWSLYLAAILGVTGILSESLSSIIEKYWFKLSNLLGMVMPKIVLGLVFFILLTPIAFVYRFFNNNLLGLNNSSDSYFTDYSSKFSKENMEKTW